MIPFRKRTFLLADTFQYRFMTVSFFYQLVVMGALAAALFVPLTFKLNETNLESAEALDAANQFLALHTRVWPALLAASILLATHAMFFSHRIAGPLYRFRKIFQAISEGNLVVSAKIRKRDYLQSEAGCLEQMVGSLRERVTAIERNHREMKTLVDRLTQAVKRNAVSDIAQGVEQLRLQMEHLTASVEGFKTVPPHGNGPQGSASHDLAA